MEARWLGLLYNVVYSHKNTDLFGETCIVTSKIFNDIHCSLKQHNVRKCLMKHGDNSTFQRDGDAIYRNI